MSAPVRDARTRAIARPTVQSDRQSDLGRPAARTARAPELDAQQISEHSGIPLSTLSKVEHDRLTLTCAKLLQVSRKLGLRMSELFVEAAEDVVQPVTARRSLGDVERAVRVEMPNYDYYYLCTELRRKRTVPVITKIRAKSVEQFGELVRHAGDEYIYVLQSSVVVATEFYDPVTLHQGQSIYVDSNMGQAYLAAEGCDEAEMLGIMSSADEELIQTLFTMHEEQKRVEQPAPALPMRRAPRRAKAA